MRRRAQAGGAAERQGKTTRSEVQPLSPGRRSSTPRLHTRWVALVLVAAACTVEGTALQSAPDAAIDVTSCDAAFAATPGASCALDDPCVRRGVDDPICCRELAFCSAGLLRRAVECDEACGRCAGDIDCTFGVAVCELERCLPCPDTSRCAACPAGWVALRRNGCDTCVCAPPSQCAAPAGCAPGEMCYPGAVCATGCDTALACCANVCATADPPCARPAPLGCQMRCPPELGCDACAAAACACTDGVWRCRAECAAGSAGCFVP